MTGAGRAALTVQGVAIELSAPAEGVLRLRAGPGALPADESWAVPAALLQAALSLEAGETAEDIRVRGGGLSAVLDRLVPHLRVTAGEGGPVLLDTPLDVAPPGLRLRTPMPPDAHYFGLGDKAGPMDRRGGAFVLWNSDTPFYGAGTDPLYKAIPFYLCVTEDAAHGVFLDNHWRTSFDFGRGLRDVLCIGAEGGPLDLYLIAGPDAASVLRRYHELTGPAPLMPRWALGFQQSRWSYTSQAEVEAVAGRLRAGAIPADAIYLDIDYQDRNRPFTVDEARFPDLPGLVGRLRAQDLRLVLITDMHIAQAPGEAYAPYDSGSACGAWVSCPDGSDFVGEVWPGACVFPDFSRAAVRDWWGGLYAEFAGLGAAGFWNDMNEPSVFRSATLTMPLQTIHRIEEPGFAPRAASHAEMHNMYGMLNSRATYDGLIALDPDRRPFVLTRASAAGGQRYAATWTGDNVSSWEHLRMSTAMVASLGLSGFAWSGADIGGFGGPKPPPELLTRWTQIGAFHPLFRYHCMTGKPPQEPWVDGPVHEAIRRRFIEERYRLLPYLYGLAEQASRTGMPMLRPVFLHYPEFLARGQDLGGTAEQFMLGPDLLVAPSPVPESPGDYRVRLPGPGWYDYWTGTRVEGERLTITPALDHLPVFVRPGAILPRQAVTQSTMQRPDGPLLLDIYPGPEGAAGTLYTDDGESFAYKDGVFLRRVVTCLREGDALRVIFGAREGSYAPCWTEIMVTIHGHEGPSAVADESGRALEAAVTGGALRFVWTERAAADALHITPVLSRPGPA